MSSSRTPSPIAATTVPRASVSRMAMAPFARVMRRLQLPIPTNLPTSPTSLITPAKLAIAAALQRLDLSTDPRKVIDKMRRWEPSLKSMVQLGIMLAVWLYSLWVMTTPSFPLKLAIPAVYAVALFMPITNQLLWPAAPVLTWVLLFFTARFIPPTARPSIHVNLLPALESAMYGANISDLQTRFTHPLLDVLAWLPYGVLHFALPGIVAIILWLFGPRGSAQYWGKAFGFMNLFGVITQILLPCAAPWYEIIHGLTPANYDMPGSPGGLLRIDRVFHSDGYANTFGNAPLVFGAFPSLHSGCAVMEALFLSHFFPFLKPFYWGYVGILWWATMYLSHHYLIDLTGGACLSVLVFYLFMPAEFKDSDMIQWPATAGSAGEYELVGSRPLMNGNAGHGAHDDVDFDEEIRKLEEEGEADIGDMRDEEEALGLGSSSGPSGAVNDSAANGAANGAGSAVSGGKTRTKRNVSWGETKVLGEEKSSPKAE